MILKKYGNRINLRVNKIPNIGTFGRNAKIVAKNTSVTLGEYFEGIVDKSMNAHEQKIRLLREAIEAGEISGYVKNFDPVKHLAMLKKSVTM